jgi:hypothetical protein
MLNRVAATLLLASLFVVSAHAQDFAGIDIPYERHVLGIRQCLLQSRVA